MIVALRRAWWLVIACAALGVGAAYAVNATSPVRYQSQVQLFVAMRDDGSSVGNALSGSQFTLQRVKSYLQVASSDQVVSPVVAQLRLPLTAGELAADISASNPLDTVLIDLGVTDTDPQRAADLANAVAQQFVLVVGNLEQPADGGTSPVKVTVTRPAVPDPVPVSPRPTLNLALGLLAGLALGAGGALLRFRLDTTIKTFEDVTAVTGSAPLGAVPNDPTIRDRPLVLEDQAGARAEAFRSLRTNLQFVDVDAPPRSIVVTSPLPEEGKSTSACNIAITLALGGARVVLVEADLRRPQACAYLGLDSATGLTDVLAGRRELQDVLVGWNRELLTVLPAGAIPPNPAELLGSRQMSALIRDLEHRFDHVIIDSAPLLPVTDSAVLAAAAGGALIVLRHRRTRREQAERSVETLRAVHARVLGTVINGIPRRRRGGYGYAYAYGSGYGDRPQPAAAASPAPLSPVDGVGPLPAHAPRSGWSGRAGARGNGRNRGDRQGPDLAVLLDGFGPAAAARHDPAGTNGIRVVRETGTPDAVAGPDRLVTLPGAQRGPSDDTGENPRRTVDLDRAAEAPDEIRLPERPAPAAADRLIAAARERSARGPAGFESVDPRLHNIPRGTPPRGTSVTGTPPNGTPVRGRHPGRPGTAGRHRRH